MPLNSILTRSNLISTGSVLTAYEDLDGVRTLDFVLIFIPIEPAFLLAFDVDPAMFQNAFEKNIIIVSPTTLIPVLKTVHSIWRYERQNKNTEAIAKQAGALHDKFVGFLESMEKVGRQIASSQGAYEIAYKQLISGTGNIVGRTHKLKELGAKTKKSVPQNVLEQAETATSVDHEPSLKSAQPSDSEPVESSDTPPKSAL